MNPVLLNDIDDFLLSDMPKLLANKSILITGATGTIGSYILCLLSALQNKVHLNCFAAARNIERLHNLLTILRSTATPITYSPFEPMNINHPIDYIIHTVSPTASTFLKNNPADVIKIIFHGTENAISLSQKKNAKLLFLSSLEVYANLTIDNVDENTTGILDIMDTRSCYPLSKILAEHFCFSAFKQNNIDIRIARLAQVVGGLNTKNDNRMPAQFIRSALLGKDIILHTKGKHKNPFIDIYDATMSFIYILLFGEAGNIYNVAAEPNETMTPYETAALIAEKISPQKIKVRFKILEENPFLKGPILP